MPQRETSRRDTNDRVVAFMATWNGSWFLNSEQHTRLVSECSDLGVLIRELQRAPWIAEFCEHFRAFLLTRVECAEFRFWSFCFELSCEAQERGRIHIHAVVSGRTTEARNRRLGDWSFEGSTPYLKFNTARGRGVEAATNRAHFYTQVHKVGRLLGFTNYVAAKDFFSGSEMGHGA